MCGIAGIFDLRGRRPIDPGLLERMNQSQLHRGPDDGGVHIEPGVGLGHRRLSIIDRAGGHQPLFNEDGSVAVVFNGEIYNFQEIANDLTRRGHRFRTHCDTEVIVHSWEEWGEECVHKFRGMFAFAIWDRNEGSLFLARDRLGVKPLYYAELEDGHLLFSSELKAMFVHPRLSRSLDPYAVEEYFALGYVPDPRTILQQVKKLPPGFTLKAGRAKGVGSPRQYWDVSFQHDRARSEDALAGELAERLAEAVRIRLMAEVPLGAFLSGGVDSSAVVAMMANEATGEPVNTCSISFGDPKFNESEFAQLVANRYRTNHSVERVDPNDFGLLDRLVGVYDEPYADSSAIPTYRVCELARKRVTVALSGDGGDENFAGYRRHRWHMYEQRVRELIPQALRGPLFGVAGRWYPKMDWAPQVLRAKTTLQALSRDGLSAYLNSVSVMDDSLREGVFSAAFRKRLQGYSAVEVFRAHAANAQASNALSAIQYIDLKTYLPGDILTKVDRASMAHALEVRVPMLDHELVEWAARVPPRLKLNGRQGKYILKRALEPFLPRRVLYREKMGFAVPLSRWFRGSLKEQVRESLLGDRLKDSGLFDVTWLREMLDSHQKGVCEYSAPIWALLMFDKFLAQMDATNDHPAVETSAETTP